MKRILVVFLMGLSLSGCISMLLGPQIVTLGDPAKLAVSSSEFPGQATIYFFRDRTMAASGAELALKTDGVRKATLYSGTYVHFPLAPGQHDLLTTWNWMMGSSMRDTKLSANFEKDKTYYFSIKVDYHFFGMQKFTQEVRQLDAEAGQERIKQYQAPAN